MLPIKSNVLNFIGGLDKVFIIPPFQRNYEWTTDQCDELFLDIINAYKNNKKHYLGNIVYYVGQNHGASYNEYILVDGQQRITSILLLLCALRDITSESDMIESINKRYLKNDIGSDRFRIRLKQTSYDAQYFISLIDNKPIADKDNNITKNYNYFISLLNKNADINPKDIYETIPKLEIVDVNLEIENDLESVQTLFEKINSTGKPLSSADLIRNFLLLSANPTEQERLYEDYWIIIERNVKNEYVSRFARDYLIMNTFNDVPDDRIYKIFKKHFTEAEALRIDILQDMHKYSKYYAWMRFEDCPNLKVNKHIKSLNFLKSDDLYPLHLYLFDKLYESNVNELIKILELLADFMLRYRIVAPSGGGGALQSVVRQILEGLNLEMIGLNYNNIHFELSNSPTPSGRYPNDDEFKESLMDSVNKNYARVVLLKIEEHETKNIPIPLDQVQIEHLMPVTLSDWWVKYLGGTDEAERIYDAYLNCIGNLAPISKGYNIKNSNRPWYDKIKNLKEVQFVVTSETSYTTEWTEDNIIKRNNDIAIRACKAITPPLERTIKYQTRDSSNEFESGIYPISDITTPMFKTKPQAIIYGDTSVEISTWKDFFSTICKISHEIDNKIFENIVATNKIHKSTSSKNYPNKDPIITQDESKLLKPERIGKTNYFAEVNLSSERARYYAKKLLDIYGLADSFMVDVSDNEERQLNIY